MSIIKKILFSKLDYQHMSKIDPKYKNIDREQLIEEYWNAHPKFNFFKNVYSIDDSSCNFLDLGAGSGSLFFWKTWLSPHREDIKMYGIDITRGEYSNNYETWNEINLETSKFGFENDFFDAGICSHVFEHIHPDKLNEVIKEINITLKPSGQFYIELPSVNSLDYPPREEWLANNYMVSQQNFYDKPLSTGSPHLKTYSFNELKKKFKKNGFNVLENGLIGDKKLAKKMISYGYHNRDYEILNYGLWLAGNWSQYYIIKKI